MDQPNSRDCLADVARQLSAQSAVATAAQEGFNAHLEGLPKLLCPYRQAAGANDPRTMAWDAGFDLAAAYSLRAA